MGVQNVILPRELYLFTLFSVLLSLSMVFYQPADVKQTILLTWPKIYPPALNFWNPVKKIPPIDIT